MDEVRQIARLYLEKLRRQMERQGKFVEVTDAAVNKLTSDGFNTAYGARFLKRHIDEKVKLPITGMWKTSSRFSVDIEDGEIVVKPTGGSIPELN
jgi:ATP-dependent Clp protease ATP-binding subunit ClpA